MARIFSSTGAWLASRSCADALTPTMARTATVTVRIVFRIIPLKTFNTHRLHTELKKCGLSATGNFITLKKWFNSISAFSGESEVWDNVFLKPRRGAVTSHRFKKCSQTDCSSHPPLRASSAQRQAFIAAHTITGVILIRCSPAEKTVLHTRVHRFDSAVRRSAASFGCLFRMIHAFSSVC